MFALLLSILTLSGPLQTDSVKVNTQIDHVTVYQNQAQVHRSYQHSLSTGKSILIFENLSEFLLEESIQLTGSGSWTLVSLSIQQSFKDQLPSTSKINALNLRKEELQDQIVAKQSELEVIKKEIAFIDQSKNIVAGNKLSADEINSLLSNYRENLTSALQRQDLANKELNNLQSKLSNVIWQIDESGRTNRSYSKKVIAVVSTSKPQEINFELTYLVNNAGWYPTYDFRSSSIDEPIELTYKANIYQQTGTDWEHISFTINSGDPSSNAIKPSLDPLLLGYSFPSALPTMRGLNTFKPANRIEKTTHKGLVTGKVIDAESGESLPGATVSIEGTNNGTSTDTNGNFILSNLSNGVHILNVGFVGFTTNRFPINIQRNGFEIIVYMNADLVGLDDVIVTAAGIRRERNALGYSMHKPEVPHEKPSIIQNNVTRNQTSFSYELSDPYSVPSDGKTHTVDIKREYINGDFKYGSVPKLSEFAYLEAKIENSSTLNLLSGEANIYFENRFVGTSYLDPNSTQDSLSVSLGKDEQIVINREKLTDYSSKNFFRNRIRELEVYEITIKNTKSEPTVLMIEDQIPVSTNEEIEIKIKELSNGKVDEETGIITWDLELAPGELKTLRLAFEIEYQKGKRLNM